MMTPYSCSESYSVGHGKIDGYNASHVYNLEMMCSVYKSQNFRENTKIKLLYSMFRDDVTTGLG